MIYKIITKYLLIIITFCLLTNIVYAQPLIDGDTRTEMVAKEVRFAGKAGFSDDASIGDIVSKVIQAFLGLLGIIFIILMLYGGYQWMTARGNEEQVNKAKETIQRAVIGLVIVLSAYAITYFIFTRLPFEGGGGPPVPE